MIVNKRYKLVALRKCKYICKVKAKTTKILQCIKTLLTVKLKNLKIYIYYLKVVIEVQSTQYGDRTCLILKRLAVGIF